MSNPCSRYSIKKEEVKEEETCGCSPETNYCGKCHPLTPKSKCLKECENPCKKERKPCKAGKCCKDPSTGRCSRDPSPEKKIIKSDSNKSVKSGSSGIAKVKNCSTPCHKPQKCHELKKNCSTGSLKSKASKSSKVSWKEKNIKS